jgi:hypothetical protein
MVGRIFLHVRSPVLGFLLLLHCGVPSPTSHRKRLAFRPPHFAAPRKVTAMLKSIQYLSFIVLAFLPTTAFAQNLRDQYKAPFEGPVLKDAFKKDTVFLCASNLAGSTGVYPESGGRQIISEFNQQSKPVIWSLVIEKEKALVTDNQGNEQVMVTTKFNSEGIVLVGAGKNESVQVITIDPNNSSFVYTTQNISIFWNRASTFVGRCTTSQKK